MDKNEAAKIVDEIISEIKKYKEGYEYRIKDIFQKFNNEKSRAKDIFKTGLEKLIDVKPEKDARSPNIINKKSVIELIGEDKYNELENVLKNSDINYIEEYMSVNDSPQENNMKGKITSQPVTIKPQAARTFLINGTTDTSGLMNDELQKALAKFYYLTKSGNILDSDKASKEYADKLIGGNNFFEPWLGDNTLHSQEPEKITMETQALEIIRKIKSADDYPVNLIGHSHGGNIMVLVVNHLFDPQNPDDINKKINCLITLSPPVRHDVQFNGNIKELNHINIYSRKDFVQQAGYIDNDDYFCAAIIAILSGFFALIPMFCRGLSGNEFKNKFTKNIDITEILDKKVINEQGKKVSYAKKLHKEILSEIKKIHVDGVRNNTVAPFAYHQATRSVELIESFIKTN